jgi:hypothetical protein
MSAPVDISKLSYNELQVLITQAEAARAAKKGEELKVLADLYAKKLEAAGFSIEEGIEAIRPYSKKQRVARGSAAPKPVRPVREGVTYKDPTSGQTWKAGSKGRIVGWLNELISQGHKAEQYAA